ncbi:MAG TPA: TauD/TfdA family dioxygenase [Burkholderiales bacterium]|nr:TauD/TfdA family dioxygenase [Burkholderiales bacterium]
MQVTKLKPAFGAAVEGISLSELNDAEFRELHDLWKAHGAMLVRGQQAMTDAQFEAFSKRFGELDPPPNQGVGRKNVPGFPDLYVVSNELDAGGEPLGALGYSEAVWHTDMSYLPVPPIASMLLARKLPAWGGNTWAASMCAAYENLPAALRERIKTLKIKHDGTRDSGGNLRKGVQDDPNPMTSKGHPHPAVIRDPGTGKPALFLGRRPRAYVMGLPLEESEKLLDELWLHAFKPENTYEHRWQVGDVLIWSNYSTMHKRDEFDKNTVRRMHRSQIKGTAAPAAYFS